MRLLNLMISSVALMLIVACTQHKPTQPELCDVWSEGQIFAFSGLDGETKWSEPFTCTLLGDRLGIRVENAHNRQLWFALVLDGERRDKIIGREKTKFASQESKIVASDVIDTKLSIEGIDTRLRLVFASRSTILGELEIINNSAVSRNVVAECWLQYDTVNGVPETTIVRSSGRKRSVLAFTNILSFEGAQPTRAFTACKLSPGDSILVDFSYSLFYGTDEEAVFDKATFEKLYEEKLALYQALQVPQRKTTPEMRKTYVKAYSVLRGNTEMPEGAIRFRWTTPDRVPHRHLWLWDSAFHAMGIKLHDTEWAADAIKAVLDYQQPDGFIAHMMHPNGHSTVTQPPVLAWAVWDVYETSGSKELLEYSFPNLKKYLEWDLFNRDRNRNGLLEWVNGGEAGMDNSPRFDNGCDFDAIDFNCWVVNEMKYLTKIAKTLNHQDEAEQWRAWKEQLCNLINEKLWDEDSGLYVDRSFTGELSSVHSIASFLPLLAGVATSKRAERLINVLQDTAQFWTPLPGPSVSKTNTAFGSNMWRGPVWINYNYCIAVGLRNYGYNKLARQLAHTTVEKIAKWYLAEGTIYEFYDPMDMMSPWELPRKRGVGAIRDYGWSAALYMRMLWELDNNW